MRPWREDSALPEVPDARGALCLVNTGEEFTEDVSFSKPIREGD